MDKISKNNIVVSDITRDKKIAKTILRFSLIGLLALSSCASDPKACSDTDAVSADPYNATWDTGGNDSDWSVGDVDSFGVDQGQGVWCADSD